MAFDEIEKWNGERKIRLEVAKGREVELRGCGGEEGIGEMWIEHEESEILKVGELEKSALEIAVI